MKLWIHLCIACCIFGEENDPPLLKSLVLVDSPSKMGKHEYESGVHIEGITVPGGNDKLQDGLMSLFYERPLSDGLIFDLKQEIATFYQQHNHPLVNVIAPHQKEATETLFLIVIEALLGKVTVKGSERTPAPAIEKWIHVKPGESIDESILLRDIHWINSNPFREVNVVYRAGEKHGTTDIDLIVSERKFWNTYVGGDNTGSAHIGRTRWFTGARLAYFFLIDHDLMLQFTTCNNIDQFKAYTFQYAARLPWRNTWNISGSYATTHPKSLPIHSNGKTYQLSGRYAIPHWISKESLFTYVVGFDFKGLNNNIFFGEESQTPAQQQFAWIGQFFGSFQCNIDKKPHKVSAGIEAYWSPGPLFPHQTEADFASLRAKATAKYFYSHLTANWIEDLPKGWTLDLRTKVQLSSTTLLSSEQFTLGGVNTVRGYDERVVGGDSGACANLEFHAPLFPVAGRWKPKIKDSLQIIAFFDAGYAWNREQLLLFPKGQLLFSTGPAIRYWIGSYFSLRCDLGFPFLAVVNDSGHPRLHFNALMSY